MSSAQQSREFVLAILEEFKDDDIAQMFLSAVIVGGALDISKRSPNLIYQGFIKGKDWVAVAKKVLEKREELYQERLNASGLTVVGQPLDNMTDAQP